MSQIKIEHLHYTYENGFEPVFRDVSLTLDTDWRLGLVGRNGRGKTTLLRLLAGELDSAGAIRAAVRFSYFPFPLPPGAQAQDALSVAREAVAPFAAMERRMEQLLARGDEAALAEYGELEARYAALDGYTIDALLTREAARLGVGEAALSRPFSTLSGGERVKLLLAALFLRKNNFLLIDEPTNHLDLQGRALLGRYLAGKRGFLLVSHDRALLDAAVDHVLSINRADLELQQGNYSSWKENRDRRDAWELARDERLRGEIRRMEEAAARSADWGRAVEASKYDTRNSGLRVDRGYIGAKAARMMQSAKNLQNRQARALEEKRSLLQNLEEEAPLKISALAPARRQLLRAEGLTVGYGARPLFAPLDFVLEQGQRLALTGPNGSGKTTLLRLLAGQQVCHGGLLWRQNGLSVPVVPQDTGGLRGPLRDWPRDNGLDPPLFFAILRKLGFERSQFELDAERCSEGQKKKLLLAASLARPAHLYLWDEPLNYLDVASREQIEELLLAGRASMIFVEHDVRFVERVATGKITLERREAAPHCAGRGEGARG